MGNKCEKHFCNEKEPKKLFPDWMKSIPDSSMLSSLTIPGTHNSCSFHGGNITETQSWSIPLQLKAGLRYFDIRLRRYDDKLKLQHGIIDQKCTFDVILKNFVDFITSQPTEAIIMAVQNEYKVKNCTKNMEALFNEYTKEYNHLIVEYKGKDLPLGEFRGKILFINVFHARVHWTPQFKIQNEWVVNVHKSVIDKKRKVKKLFNRAVTLVSDGFIYLNYLSGSSDYGIITPNRCADSTNKEVFKYKGRLGIVLCDFPGEDLVEHLIEQNFTTNPAPMGDPKELINKTKVGFIHLNTKKYLSLNQEGNKLICSKEKYLFDIGSTNNEHPIFDGDTIKVTDPKSSFNIDISIIKKSRNSTYNTEKKTLNNIYNGDIVYISTKVKTEKDENIVNRYFSSDYSFKSKKIQQTVLTHRNEENCEWIIELS